MATNRNSIPSTLVEDKLEGLEREEGSVADLICDKRPVDTHDGTVTVVPTKENIARVDPDELIEIGSQAPLQDDELDSVSFHIKRAAQGERIEPPIIRSIDNRTGRSELERKMRKARNTAHARIDSYLQGLLTDNNKNTQFDVTSNYSTADGWSDESSEPLRDIEEAFDSCPGADTLFIGRKAEKDLKNHPDLAGEFHNYKAGQLDPGQLVNLLKTKFPSLKTVVTGSTFFSDANAEGDDVSLNLSYELSDVVWMGHRKGLIMVEYSAFSPQTRVSDPDPRSGSQVFVYERQIDILRPQVLSELGVEFTNT